MSKERNTRVCPVERAGGLDNRIRRLLQNPNKILSPYIKKGMTVLDVGCGPGFFTIEIAKMLDNSGKVIAADLQEGMLEKLRQKVKGTTLKERIVLQKCERDIVGVTEKVDFVLAFWMVHEVPSQDRLFEELKSILNPEGKILIIEPKFHVKKKGFEAMVGKLKSLGFNIIDRPKVFYSRSVLIEK